MIKVQPNRIFARAADPVGRSEEIDRICQSTQPTLVLAKPGAGSSEVLRQCYDRTFFSQRRVIPVYFEFIRTDRTVRHAAERFVTQFLTQVIAFRRNQPDLVRLAPSLSDLAGLATPADAVWIDRLIQDIDRPAEDRLFARRCFGAPIRAAASAAQCMVLIDGLANANTLDAGAELADDLLDIASRSSSPFVLCGPRRALFARTSFDSLRIDELPFADAAVMTASLAERLGVEINDETRDLTAVQLGGNAVYISLLLVTAAEKGVSLTSFERFEQIYADEIFGGRLGRHIDRQFADIVPASIRTDVLGLLIETAEAPRPVNFEYWQRRLRTPFDDLEKLTSGLHEAEFINDSSGQITADRGDTVFTDYLHTRKALDLDSRSRALTVGGAITDYIERAPRLMAAAYRRRASIGLREVLLSFDGQAVPRSLIDYAVYKQTVKGGDNVEAMSRQDTTDAIDLPSISFAAHTSTFSPRLLEQIETERSAIGLGFSRDGNREHIAWLAVEIDSKLEAPRDLAEFWCDRLEAIAVEHEFENHRLWLVAPEGFDDDAIEVLSDRSAYGSSRKQVELLRQALGHDESMPAEVPSGGEYEFVVPMGDDSEIVAARAVEEIARRHEIPQKAINQVKTALVEACINAAEHSLSPDRKIYLKFAVGDDHLTVTVANRGLRLADKPVRQVTDNEGRRGWGLKLMKGLMDDVKIEDTDDGTRITMTKRIAA